ncbi:MAG: peptidase, partial [Dokdonella sp.]
MKQNALKPLVVALTLAAAMAACAPAVKRDAVARDTSNDISNGAFDVSELDSNTNACANFSDYVNAKWIAANPIPADKSRWTTFDVLREKSLDTQHG